MTKKELMELVLSDKATIGGVITGTTNKCINIFFNGTLSELKNQYPDFSRKMFIDLGIYYNGVEYNENVISCRTINIMLRK